MDRYLKYAWDHNMDEAFAAWLRSVDEYSIRFFNIDMFELDQSWDPVAHYIEGMTPRGFVRYIMVPTLVNDFGCHFVSEIVAERVLWGNSRDISI